LSLQVISKLKLKFSLFNDINIFVLESNVKYFYINIQRSHHQKQVSISSTFYEQLLSVKRKVKTSVFFALLGSANLKGARKTSVRLTLGENGTTTTLTAKEELSGITDREDQLTISTTATVTEASTTSYDGVSIAKSSCNGRLGNQVCFIPALTNQRQPNVLTFKSWTCDHQSTIRVCHGFRLTKRDDYFWVDFDHF